MPFRLMPSTRSNPPRSPSFHRRDLLRVATTGVLGLSLPQWLALQANASGGSSRGKAKSVLVILEQGGLSHIDTWDPKPDVVAEHRSPHKPIPTKANGVFVTDLLSKTASVMDKIAIVRSMHHPKSGADGHPKGTQYVLSGVHPGGPTEMPDLGSIVTHILGSQNTYLPPYIMVPGNDEQAAETRTGFLPSGTQVFKTGGKDVSSPEWKVEGLLPRGENSQARMQLRSELLATMDRRFLDASPQRLPVQGMDRFFEQAFDILSSPQAASAFDLSRESQSVREQYGPGHRGSCYLAGRRLIEAGVRFVTVDVRWPFDAKKLPGGTNLNWDHHDFIYASGTCNLPGAGGGGAGRRGIGTWEMMGSTDQAFSALIRDMDERGLLAETLVCFVTEFGRTPRINKFQGRDHWTHGYSIAFAGAGVPGGQVIGSTDREGGYASDQPHTFEAYAVTLFDKLGIDRDQPLYTPTNRPIYFGHVGEPIAGLF